MTSIDWQFTEAVSNHQRGFVYAVYTENPRYWKIGLSVRSPLSRLANMQTDCPLEIKFWGAMLVYQPVLCEKAIHKYLAPWRFRGEWFIEHEEVIKIATALRDEDKETLKCIVDMKKVKLSRLRKLLAAIDAET